MVQNNSNMDIDINISRGRSAFSSINSSRALSVYSDLSSIPYYKRMEVQSNKLTWDKQVDLNERKDFSLSYATSKVGENKLASKITDYTPKDGEQHSNIKVWILNNIPIPQGVICKSTHPKITSLWWYYFPIIQAYLLQQPPFL